MKWRVVLNGQNLLWTNVDAAVRQGSILGPLWFLIYINDLSDNLTSNVKLFADDTSLFSVAHDVNTSTKELNNDLKKVLGLTIGIPNGKWVSILIRANKPRKSFSVASHRDRPAHL